MNIPIAIGHYKETLAVLRKVSSLGLTHIDVFILYSLAKPGIHTPSSLSEYLNITKPQISAQLQSLLNKKLIDIKRPRADKRVRIISLTTKGDNTLRKLWAL